MFNETLQRDKRIWVHSPWTTTMWVACCCMHSKWWRCISEKQGVTKIYKKQFAAQKKGQAGSRWAVFSFVSMHSLGLKRPNKNDARCASQNEKDALAVYQNRLCVARAPWSSRPNVAFALSERCLPRATCPFHITLTHRALQCGKLCPDSQINLSRVKASHSGRYFHSELWTSVLSCTHDRPTRFN